MFRTLAHPPTGTPRRTRSRTGPSLQTTTHRTRPRTSPSPGLPRRLVPGPTVEAPQIRPRTAPSLQARRRRRQQTGTLHRPCSRTGPAPRGGRGRGGGWTGWCAAPATSCMTCGCRAWCTAGCCARPATGSGLPRWPRMRRAPCAGCWRWWWTAASSPWPRNARSRRARRTTCWRRAPAGSRNRTGIRRPTAAPPRVTHLAALNAAPSAPHRAGPHHPGTLRRRRACRPTVVPPCARRPPRLSRFCTVARRRRTCMPRLSPRPTRVRS